MKHLLYFISLSFLLLTFSSFEVMPSAADPGTSTVVIYDLRTNGPAVNASVEVKRPDTSICFTGNTNDNGTATVTTCGTIEAGFTIKVTYGGRTKTIITTDGDNSTITISL